MFEGIKEGIKRVVSAGKQVKTRIDKRSAKKNRENVKRLNEQKVRREKSLPHIRKIAKEYGATVVVYDSEAYVHIGKGEDERGTYIPYGTSSDEIRAKLERIAYKKATAAKIKSGIGKVVKTAKAGRKAFLDSGIGGGSMYGNPKDMWKR